MSTAKRWSGPSPASRWMRPAGASAGTVSVHGLAVATGRLEAQLARVLDRRSRLPDHRRLAHHLSREFDALFTYLRCPGLEATNYRGEHAIRPAVVTRTVWGGHRTATGAHTQEVLTSVLRTGHQHDNDPVPHLVALLRSPQPYVLDLALLRSPQPYVLDLDPKSRASPH